MDWVLLAIGGFCVGALAWCAYCTVKTEPEIRYHYLALSAGVFMVGLADVLVSFFREVSAWFEIVTIIGYFIGTLGLVGVARARQHRRHSNRGGV